MSDAAFTRLGLLFLLVVLGSSGNRFLLVSAFREKVGFTPKVWCRIQRFQHAVQELHTGADVRWVKNAGSVFIGHHTPQSMGDYISGPNHVLPTGRNGRVRGGLSVLDFVKVITVQHYTRAGLKKMGPHAIALAEAEGLNGHAESVRVRMQ